MGLFFILLTFLPIIYNFYNTFHKHIPTIPMQNSLIQTFAFIIFSLSLFCSASMLPCGRYYYEPEGGYVGNPWVKFSLQYIYLYMAWFVHHLDLIDHYVFQFFQVFLRKYLKISKKYTKLARKMAFRFFNFTCPILLYKKTTFLNSNYKLWH